MALPLPQRGQPRGPTPGEAIRRAFPVEGCGEDGVGGGQRAETSSRRGSGSSPFAAREVVFK